MLGQEEQRAEDKKPEHLLRAEMAHVAPSGHQVEKGIKGGMLIPGSPTPSRSNPKKHTVGFLASFCELKPK